ncbi:hypothetical protein I5M32_16315 [Pedobacter sp. SD-b]|uniref:Uncharacterized protein n=1 Tax=Pedobacter segetis TaxID=2793069 RepID=A0ABS1BNP7_9SPHI|nr:hypothetical protein [Pedobacter segetis]MBK0384527.1 hypothetical protein [Pedobacter segetis]
MENQEINHKIQLFNSTINIVSVTGYILYFIVRKTNLNGILAYFTLTIFLFNLLFVIYSLVFIIRNNSLIIQKNKKFGGLFLNLISCAGFVILIIMFLK